MVVRKKSTAANGTQLWNEKGKRADTKFWRARRSDPLDCVDRRQLVDTAEWVKIGGGKTSLGTQRRPETDRENVRTGGRSTR